MKNQASKTMFTVQSAAIAALYVALSLIFAPISYGMVQVRIAEMLTILPLFSRAAVPGLFLGCLFANLFSGAVVWDIVFGSLATLAGAFLGYRLRKKRWLVPVPSILANVIVVPLILRYGYGMDIPLLLLALYVAIGEVIGSYVLGEILGAVLWRYRSQIFRI